MPIKNSTSATIFRWRPACWLRVTGNDAADFLQGQLTNDLRVLPQQRAVYGLWLTVKGKVLADSFIVREGTSDAFWIGSYFSPATTIRKRIESHVIADDVVCEDFTETWAGINVMGEGVQALLESAAAVGQGWVFRGRRDRAANVECIYPVAEGEPVWIARVIAEAGVIDDDEITRRRIDSGIPAVPADLGPGDLPNEGGLDQEAISYTKGCYLGQEVMARLKAMGQVRRRLLRVRGTDENFPALPAAVFAGPRQVGELRSAVRERDRGWIGLAMLSLRHVKTGAELAFAADAQPSFRLIDSP